MDKPKVLLADSDNFFRSTMHRALTRLGYQVVATGNAADAIDLFEHEKFDAALVEVAIVPRDGLEVLRELKTRNPDLPVILLTETRTLGSAAIGVRAGAFDYLVKPIEDVNRLADLLDRAIEEEYKAHAEGQAPAETSAPVSEKTAPPSAPPLPIPPVVPPQLTELMNTIVGGAASDQVLALIASTCAQTLRAEHAAVLLTHPDGQLHLAASYGYPDSNQAAREYLSAVGDDFAWRVVNERQTLWRAATDTLPSQMGAPITFANQVLGVVAVYPTRAREDYTPTDLDTCNLLVSQGAAAVQLTRAQEQIATLRQTDELTGLLNREHFHQQADREFRRSWRFGQPLAVITFDLDSFEKINALLSRTGGDAVMKQVSGVVRPLVRSVDLMGRLRDDQFAVALTMGTAETANIVAERLRRAIGQIEISTPEGLWQMTATFGIATYPRENCASIYDLTNLAEQAMRAAKRAGRNRIQIV